MASYGSFQASREIGSAYGSTVYSARKAGEATDSFAVKVYALEALIGDSSQNRAELDALLRDLDRTLSARIELQKKTAEVSPYLAPILESGQDETGIWYATRLYPRSLQKIIAGHVFLGKENLHHVLLSVVRGALALQKNAERPHGNLKASNVLISAAAKISEAQVVLADAMPGGSAEAKGYERADLRAVGELLLQLVRRRELTETSDWLILPIESSEEWTQMFGKESSAWLALCNRLLDPNLSPENYTLEQLERDLVALAPKPAVSPKTLAIAGGVVLLGIVGVAGFLLTGNKGRVLLSSDPPGAIIYQGNERVGPTPRQLKLPKGEYNFEARFGALSNQTFHAVVQGRATITHQFGFDYGSVAIGSDPPGAAIMLGGTNLLQGDGKTTARTPFVHQFLRPGERFNYELSLDNQHETAVLSATAPSGRQAVQLTAKLAELRAGEVLVEFDYNLRGRPEVVVSAQTLPNFQFKGELPQRKGLPPGTYKLSAQYRPDWPAAEANVVVDPNSKPKASFHFDAGWVVLEKGEQDGVRFSINGGPAAVLGADAVTIPLRTGTVTLGFEAEGFEPATLKTNIVADTRLALIAPRLAPVLGFIALASDPPGATIAAPVGKQWQTLANQLLLVSLPPGTYPMTATFKGLRPVSKSVPIQKGKTNRVDFPFLYGKVRLTSNLPGAVARDPLTDSWLPLDSGPTLILPDGHFDLAARDSLHGLPDEIIPIDVKGDRGLVPLNFAFKYGTVVIQSVPPTGVEVRTNGVRSGETPLTNLFVKAGNVKYELYLKELKRSRTVSTNVAAGATCLLSADLTKEEARGYTNSVGMELVMVNEGYFIGRWEVSEEQYKQVMGAEDTRAAAGSAKQPVTGVGWSNVLAFCAKLTALDNSSLTSHALPGWQYAIPGEKDWLSAAGASPETYARAVFLPMPLMNIGDPARNSTNEFGLFDMFGNVAEWCLGSNTEPITLGGSNLRARPSRTDFLRITAAQLGADAVAKGNKVTGFRCVLRGKAQP